MANLSLKTLVNSKSGAGASITALFSVLQGPLGLEDPTGRLLLGASEREAARVPVIHEGATLGWVTGPAASARAVGSLLEHIAAREFERRALAAEVLHLYREVHLIDQLSEQLTALLDLSAVGNSALAQAHRLIAASCGGILLRDTADGPLRWLATLGNIASIDLESAFLAAVLERGTAEIVNDRAGDLRCILCAPLRAKQRTVGVIVMASDADGASYTAADLKLLNTIALQTAAAVENSMLCAEMVDSARDREQLTAIQRELDTARAIQHSLVPRVFPPFPERTDFEMHAQMTSARAVGGDFFDYFLIDDDHLGIVIGDVSGKGTASALYMAVTRTHLRTTALRGMAPELCLLEVNRVLVSEKASSMYATCFYGILNTRTGELRHSSAGHSPPYRICAGGEVESLADKGGPPLGMFAWKEYEGACVTLNPGDGLFLSTDGVSEANNAVLDDFTDDRLVAVLREAIGLPSKEIIGRVTEQLLSFTAGAPQSDDITMVAVRLAPPCRIGGSQWGSNPPAPQSNAHRV